MSARRRPERPPLELLPHLRRARNLAEGHYAEPLDLEGLAAAAGASKYYFLRCFAATYGRTPAVYPAERRIERAQDLLRATNVTVTEACGWSATPARARSATSSPSWWACHRPPTGRNSPPRARRGYVVQQDHPELEVTLMVPGPPLDDNLAEAIRRSMANGALGLNTDDCQKAYEELTAKGVEFVQPPSERPYGVEAVLRDNSGNRLVLVEKREFDPATADGSGESRA